MLLLEGRFNCQWKNPPELFSSVTNNKQILQSMDTLSCWVSCLTWRRIPSPSPMNMQCEEVVSFALSYWKFSGYLFAQPRLIYLLYQIELEIRTFVSWVVWFSLSVCRRRHSLWWLSLSRVGMCQGSIEKDRKQNIISYGTFSSRILLLFTLTSLINISNNITFVVV